jgi:hypothetical protein
MFRRQPITLQRTYIAEPPTAPRRGWKAPSPPDLLVSFTERGEAWKHCSDVAVMEAAFLCGSAIGDLREAARIADLACLAVVARHGCDLQLWQLPNALDDVLFEQRPPEPPPEVVAAPVPPPGALILHGPDPLNEDGVPTPHTAPSPIPTEE